MRPIGKLALAASCAFLMISPAHAETDAQAFLKLTDGSDGQYYRTILHAWGYGIMVGTALASQFQRQSAFCPPDKLTLTPEQDVKILRDYLKANPANAKLPTTVALALAYRFTFPCSATP